MTQSNPKQPTARQLEAMVNLYCGDDFRSRRLSPKHKCNALCAHGEVPPWGVKDRWHYAQQMGGAVHRMQTAMAEAGWLEWKRTGSGRAYSQRKLTAAALAILKAKYPGLPSINVVLAQAQAAEAEAAQREAAEQAEFRQQSEARRIERQRERAERMAAVLRDYQVAHSLSDEQLRDIWLRVVDEEHRL
jgi:hypothetical protein